MPEQFSAVKAQIPLIAEEFCFVIKICLKFIDKHFVKNVVGIRSKSCWQFEL